MLKGLSMTDSRFLRSAPPRLVLLATSSLAALGCGGETIEAGKTDVSSVGDAKSATASTQPAAASMAKPGNSTLSDESKIGDIVVLPVGLRRGPEGTRTLKENIE
jgi:hypothetical protein